MKHFSLQKLQFAGALVLGVVYIVLAATGVWSDFSHTVKYERLVRQFDQFDITLRVMSTISAERGPANGAMGALAGAKRLAALRNARSETDKSLAALETQFSVQGTASPAVQAAFDDVRRSLTAGRLAVDRAIFRATERPDGEAVTRAVHAMFAAADHAGRLRDLFGSQIVAGEPDLASGLQLATTASTLRERTGRLGSYVVLQLVEPPEGQLPDAQAVRAETERIREMTAILRAYTVSSLPTPEIVRAIAEMESVYLNGAMPYALSVSAAADRGKAITVETFNENYVPGLRSVVNLRDAILAALRNTMHDARAQAERSMFVTAVLAMVGLVVLLALGLLFHYGLFRPFEEVRRQIREIARGELSPPAPVRHFGAELTDMFENLEFLRQQQQVKHGLELERREIVAQLKRLSEVDPLTGLYNRRTLNEMALALLTDNRASAGLAVIVVDVDRFKTINDRFGHSIGDEVLCRTARNLAIGLREGDILARYGGEEFVIVLSDVDESEAVLRAERLRRQLHAVSVPIMGPEAVTASFGIAWHPAPQLHNWEELLNLADRRLYLAKQQGRNRVCAGDFSVVTAARA